MAMNENNRGLLLSDNFTLSLDISEGQGLTPMEYAPLRGGAVFIKADTSPSSVRRKYVDGEKSVPLSDSRKFTVKLLPSAEDSVSGFLLESAKKASPVKYAYTEEAGDFSESGVLLATSVISEISAEGVTYTIELENC